MWTWPAESVPASQAAAAAAAGESKFPSNRVKKTTSADVKKKQREKKREVVCEKDGSPRLPSRLSQDNLSPTSARWFHKPTSEGAEPGLSYFLPPPVRPDKRVIFFHNNTLNFLFERRLITRGRAVNRSRCTGGFTISHFCAFPSTVTCKRIKPRRQS